MDKPLSEIKDWTTGPFNRRYTNNVNHEYSFAVYVERGDEDWDLVALFLPYQGGGDEKAVAFAKMLVEQGEDTFVAAINAWYEDDPCDDAVGCYCPHGDKCPND